MKRSLNELALFAGAGGGILGGKLLGWRTVCAVECDPYAASVLVARQNDGILAPFPIWDDVRTFDGRPWRGIVDVVSGGFPCQPFSTASRGRKVAIDLWPEMLRIILEVEPKFVFAENVQREPIERAADDLRARGYVPRIAPVDAAELGSANRRARWWLVADADGDGQSRFALDAEMAGIFRMAALDVWKDEPADLGVHDGMANRVDRLKALGNGQVPAVAATAWRILNATSGE
jgi:DNA (cytosine-5)-methyltransferase 1